jgi:hypothetical protein
MNPSEMLWPDLKVNAAGISHDRLRQCCSNYLRPDIASHLNAADSRPTKRSRQDADVRNHALLKFTFLEYAIRHIFAHADNAQAAGVNQDDFLKECDLKTWVRLYNIVEKFQTRRLQADVDLRYVVAESGCPNLVEVLMKDRSFPLRKNGRLGNLVFAAIAADNYPTFELLVEPYRQMHRWVRISLAKHEHRILPGGVREIWARLSVFIYLQYRYQRVEESR